MGVTRQQRYGKRAKSMKARRPWSRTVRTLPSKFRTAIPRIRNPDFGFPDKLTTKLRYVSHNSLSGAGQAIGYHVFRLNSLFDPDLTGTGHQPMYFDQFCGPVGSAPYSKYRVTFAKVTTTFSQLSQPAGSTATPINYGPMVVGLTAHTTDGLYNSTPEGICETSNTSWTVIGDKAGGNNVKKLTASFYPIRDLGLDQNDESLTAAYNANPAQQFYAIPWKMDRSSNGGIMAAFTEIIYTVEFSYRNEVNPS